MDRICFSLKKNPYADGRYRWKMGMILNTKLVNHLLHLSEVSSYLIFSNISNVFIEKKKKRFNLLRTKPLYYTPNALK